jgi:hypothetical protein
LQKAKLAEAERDLATAQSALKDKQAALRAIQKKVADLKRTYEQSLAKRDDLESQQKKTSARLERAHKLTGGLGAWLLCGQRAHALPFMILQTRPHSLLLLLLLILVLLLLRCCPRLAPLHALTLSFSTLDVSSALCCR